jgi:cellulose biosynthesis protein BcsQ
MAFVITVVLLKGGVSKSTTALALGEAAALSMPVVIVDMDPMASLVRWSELAADAGRPLRCEVVGHPGPGVPGRLHALAGHAQLVVIDTPGPGALDRSREAVGLADQVVMPVPPNQADLDRVHATVKMADDYDIPARAVLTQVRGGIEDSAAAAVTLKSWGVPVYDTQLPLTVAVQRAYGKALTSGPLMRFGVDLMTEILKET